MQKFYSAENLILFIKFGMESFLHLIFQAYIKHHFSLAKKANGHTNGYKENKKYRQKE